MIKKYMKVRVHRMCPASHRNGEESVAETRKLKFCNATQKRQIFKMMLMMARKTQIFTKLQQRKEF